LNFSTKTILNKLNDKLVYVPVIFLDFAGIPEPALAGEFTCRKAGKRPYGRAAKPPPTARDIPQNK
jgi:hypothetical protein